MTDDGLTPTQRAFLQSQYHRGAFEDMSAADINRLDIATFARLTGREFVIEPVEPPGRPRQAQGHPGQDPQPEPIDIQAMGMAEYAAIRDRYIRPSSGTGRGLFD